jgi:flagellar biosynthesis/type III secretory pathway chaperone
MGYPSTAPSPLPWLAMSRIATDNLSELIAKKHQLLIQLREIGRKQATLVEGNPQPLLQLLAAKQHLITGLQLVERHLRPYQQEAPDARVWRSPADRERCAELADECRVLLSEVVQCERDQETRILERRNQVAAQLQQAAGAQQAADAYRQYRVDRPSAPMGTASSAST